MAEADMSSLMLQKQQEEVVHLPYYHPNLRNMDDVRGLMIQYVMKDGCFIVRNSISRPGVLTVTVMHTNSIKHFNICTTNSSYYLQERHFKSLSELIEYYKEHDVPNVEGVEHVRLAYPIHFILESLQLHRGLVGVNRSISEVTPQSIPQRKMLGPSSMSLDRGSGARLVEIPTDIGPNSNSSKPETNTATIPDPQMPQLPQAPPRRKHKFSNPFRKEKKRSREDSESEKRPASIEERPPMPIPTQDPVYQHYDVVRDTETDHSKELIYHLKRSERYGEMCECGLSMDDSMLPMGWSMHISREAPTEGRIFFMGPDEQTVWELPFPVTLQLNVEQQERIKNLRQQYLLHYGQDGFSGSGSGGSVRSSAPVAGFIENGQSSTSSRVSTASSRRGQSMVNLPSGPVSMNRIPQQHECHVEDDVFQTS